ncbi:MAG: hypothetical protein KGZ79_07525 [Dethiobacter sp.]|jgi:NSS family neurotransmitter:Na+ symporter|nr:hypothetical protein [Dethiobacter sp.]
MGVLIGISDVAIAILMGLIVIPALFAFTAYVVDQKGWSRKTASVTIGLLVFAFGVPATLSQGVLSNLLIMGRDILGLMDFVASNFLLPVSGLLLVVFLGWVWSTGKAVAEIKKGSPRFYWGRVWSFLIRYIMPIAILYIFIAGITS